MPRPPYIKVGAEDAISPRGSVFASSTLREQHGDKRTKPCRNPAPKPPLKGAGQRASGGVVFADFYIQMEARR